MNQALKGVSCLENPTSIVATGLRSPSTGTSGAAWPCSDTSRPASCDVKTLREATGQGTTAHGQQVPHNCFPVSHSSFGSTWNNTYILRYQIVLRPRKQQHTRTAARRELTSSTTATATATSAATTTTTAATAYLVVLGDADANGELEAEHDDGSTHRRVY